MEHPRRIKTRVRGIYREGKEGRYYITYRVNGKKYERKIDGKLSDAVREKIERTAKAKRGRYDVLDRQEKTSFQELLALYEVEGDRKEYILNFRQTYQDYFGTYRLSGITRNDIFNFRDHIKATPKQRGGMEVTDSTVNRALSGLRRLFNFAIQRDFMEESMNPFPRTPKSHLFYPEKKGRRNFFSEAQIISIYKAAQEWMKPLIAISFYTGMRMGEVRMLRWEYVDLEAGIIRLPETKTLKDPSGIGQQIVMQKELVEMIGRIPRKHDWVFVQGDGLPYEHWQIQKPFKALLKSLNIDTEKFSWKEIRHTTGTLMHLKGADPLAIQDQLRHTDFNTTKNFYIGSEVEWQREQVERLTLEEKPGAEA